MEANVFPLQSFFFFHMRTFPFEEMEQLIESKLEEVEMSGKREGFGRVDDRINRLRKKDF